MCAVSSAAVISVSGFDGVGSSGSSPRLGRFQARPAPRSSGHHGIPVGIRRPPAYRPFRRGLFPLGRLAGALASSLRLQRLEVVDARCGPADRGQLRPLGMPITAFMIDEHLRTAFHARRPRTLQDSHLRTIRIRKTELVPTTLTGLLLFVVLLLPGFAYLVGKERHGTERSLSPFRETVAVVAASITSELIVLGLFAAIRALWPWATPSPGALIVNGGVYVGGTPGHPGHYKIVAVWGVALLAAATLGAYLATKPGIRGLAEKLKANWTVPA